MSTLVFKKFSPFLFKINNHIITSCFTSVVLYIWSVGVLGKPEYIKVTLRALKIIMFQKNTLRFAGSLSLLRDGKKASLPCFTFNQILLY